LDVGETAHWSGTLFFARQWALYRGPVGPTDAHAHRAHQVVVASPPRLMHLFREELRISLRGHVRWERMRRALSVLGQGASIARAAHEAGFADAAHLSRVFRATFGMAPSALARSVRWVPVDAS
jgi:methylphosphotriester-DNA--protein-cysteine methyltransferase